MNITAIRPGNLLTVRGELKLTQGEKESRYVTNDHDRETGSTKYMESLNYIPLTEGWLERLGFDYLDSSKWHLGDFDLLKDGSSGWRYFDLFLFEEYTNIVLLYVHELQNLYYYITGDELIIKPE
jgi:hypothetical protein